MSLRFSNRSFRPASLLSIRWSLGRQYASKPGTSTEPLGEGIVGKGDKNAKPVILEHAAPADSKDPEVKKHNEEFEKRPDRAANAINDKNEATVDKNFWKGQGGVDREA
ncbi:MAG: hypothetical protein GOMPHAMPRED_002481 [Gomphillus americanus]|uniref:Uncharacterized protein n=1 Tax=Gomphillus americanus TaxID=1940652 RepID=A0A8H3FCU1_9LECA|nr:MAG: hypothetical protein GOMPHAMPRED_002481 [Gomphillus americanus]